MPTPCGIILPVLQALKKGTAHLEHGSTIASFMSLHMVMVVIAERRTGYRSSTSSMESLMQKVTGDQNVEGAQLWDSFRNYVLMLLGDGRGAIPVPASGIDPSCEVLRGVFSSLEYLFEESIVKFSYCDTSRKIFSSPRCFADAMKALVVAMSSEILTKPSEWPSALGEIYAGVILGENRSNTGSWYTPTIVARKMAKECVDAYIRENSLTHHETSDMPCLDPSMGCGALLLSAVEYLHKLCPDSSLDMSKIISHCVYGIDADVGAVNVGRFLLMLKSLPSPPLNKLTPSHLRHLKVTFQAIFRHVCPGDTLLSTMIADTKRFSDADADAVQKLCNFGHPVLYWDNVWPELFREKINDSKKGFAMVFSNPPYLKKNSLLKWYKQGMANASDNSENVDISAMLSSRYICWRTSSQPNVFTMFVEASISLLRSQGAMVIISPGSLLVHDSMKNFRRRFFSERAEASLCVKYVGDMRGNAHLFRGAECYPVLLCFVSDSVVAPCKDTVIVETLRKIKPRKSRKHGDCGKQIAKAENNSVASDGTNSSDLIVVGGRRNVQVNVLKSYPFWQSAYSLSPLLRPPANIMSRTTRTCRPNLAFKTLNTLVDVCDRPRKDSFLSRIYQVTAFDNKNVQKTKSKKSSIMIPVVVSSSVGRHVSLWGHKSIKVNQYTEVSINKASNRPKTERSGKSQKQTHPHLSLSKYDWDCKFSDRDRDELSNRKIIFATMCAAPRCYYASIPTLSYCLPTARFNIESFRKVCIGGLESQDLFMTYICSCLNSDILTSWIMDVHGADSMNNNCMNMNMNLLNSIPIPFPSHQPRFRFAEVDVSSWFPQLASSTSTKEWQSRVSKRINDMDDISIVQLIASLGRRLKSLLQGVLQRFEHETSPFRLKQRNLRKRALCRTMDNEQSFIKSAHHCYSEYALHGKVRIFAEKEAQVEFWCNKIIDSACEALYFRRPRCCADLR